MTKGNVKGGAIKARLEFVRDCGEAAVERVLARLPEADRQACAHIMTGMWYPFAMNERLDEAVAAELGQQPVTPAVVISQ